MSSNKAEVPSGNTEVPGGALGEPGGGGQGCEVAEINHESNSLCSGIFGERLPLRYYLTAGMLLSGLFTSLFGLGYFWNIHVLWYFVLVQVRASSVLHSGLCSCHRKITEAVSPSQPLQVTADPDPGSFITVRGPLPTARAASPAQGVCTERQPEVCGGACEA